MKQLLIVLILCCASIASYGQNSKAIVDKKQIKISLQLALDIYNNTPSDSIYALTDFKQIYKSPEVGFKNLWALYYNDSLEVYQFVIRGTVNESLSWLANYYSPMIAAKGSLELAKDNLVDYEFSSDPRAKVHAGWSMASMFLLPDIEHKLDSIYNKGAKQVIISGHSQGAAIATLITAALNQKQLNKQLPTDLQIKTYALAAPKVGDTYFSYDYLAKMNFRSFSIINAQDWVAQVPLTSQQLTDINPISPFNVENIKHSLQKIPWPKRWIARSIVNQIKKPSKKAVKKYQKYLGNMVFGFIKKDLPDLKEPTYELDSNYQTTGIPIILNGFDIKSYQDQFNNANQIMSHHNPDAYLFLLDYIDIP
ncbi:lipase family protein [Myroides sp. LJL119]